MTIDPLQPKQIIQSSPQANPTANQIKQLREMASQLMSQKTGNVYGTLGGLGKGFENFTDKISGAMDYNRANDLERQMNASKAVERKGYYGNETDPNAGAGGPAESPPSQAAGGTPPQSQQLSSAAQPPMQAQNPSQGAGSTRLASLGTDGVDLGGGPQEEAMRLSAKGETGRSSLMGALFNISGDTAGSKSYGPFGLNSKTGSAGQIAKEHPELGLTAPPGSSEFDRQWRLASATNKEGMKKAHMDWYSKHIWNGLADDMTKRGVPETVASDPRVQKYMADRKIQMGNVGLDSALRYASVNSNGNPEEFIRRVSMADKQRIPDNFRTYLKDRPQDVRGLANRIDLRHGAVLNGQQFAQNAPSQGSMGLGDYQGNANSSGRTALAMADPGSTERMVDYQRNANTPGRAALNGPQFAQNTSSRASPRGSMSQQLGDYLYGMATRGGEPLTEAEILDAVRARAAINPQYDVNDYGVVSRKAIGEIPRVLGIQPGFPGKITEDPDAPGAGFITRYNPKTGQFERDILVPGGAGGGPTSSNEPSPENTTAPPARTPAAPPSGTPSAPVNNVPPPKPGGGEVVQGAPTTQPSPTASASAAAPAAAGGPLTTNPPGVPAGAKAGSKLAMADIDPFENVVRAGLEGQSSKLPEQSKVASNDVPDYNIEKPKTPEEVGVREALDEAYANPTQPLKMRNVWTEAAPTFNNPRATGFEKLDALGNIKGTKAASQADLQDAMKTQRKGFGDLQKNIRDTEKQSIHLSPELKGAVELLNSPDFEAGPASDIVTVTRALREEAADKFRRMGEAAKASGADPSTYNKLADWIFDPAKSPSATTNQIYTKFLSGAILQSLRGMLGPNAGQFRVQELKMLEQAFGNPNLTLNANKAVMNMIDRMNDRSILIGRMASEYVRKKGGLDASFEDALSKFETKHPVFTPADITKLGRINATGKTPEDAAAPTAPAASPTAPSAPRGFRPNQPGSVIPGLEDYMKKRGIQLPGSQ